MNILITGASSGIGKDIAIELSKRGYELILVARNNELLEEVQKEVKTKSTIIVLDLSNKENCIKLYDKIKKEDIDVLVNNAGFGEFGEFINTSLDNLFHSSKATEVSTFNSAVAKTLPEKIIPARKVPAKIAFAFL